MADWTYTKYVCVGDKSDIDEIEKALITCKNDKVQRVPQKGFGTEALGCEIAALGINPYEERYKEKRGEVQDFSRTSEQIIEIVMECAWCEQSGYRRAIKDKFKSVKVYYIDEESNNGYFATNDKEGIFFTERYYLSGWSKSFDFEADYFTRFEDVVSYLVYKEILTMEQCKDVRTIQEALDDLELPDDEYINLYEYQILEEDEP